MLLTQLLSDHGPYFWKGEYIILLDFQIYHKEEYLHYLSKSHKFLPMYVLTAA